MNEMPQSINRLYFPIVNLYRKEIVAYVAYKSVQDVTIESEEVVVVSDY